MWKALKRLWEGWKKIAHKIGNFQARVLLTVFYAVLVLPFGSLVWEASAALVPDQPVRGFPVRSRPGRAPAALAGCRASSTPALATILDAWAQIARPSRGCFPKRTAVQKLRQFAS